MHQLAYDMGVGQLQAARAVRRSLGSEEAGRQLRSDLRPKLGDIEPATQPRAQTLWKRLLSGAEIEAVSLDVEPGISVPMLILRPAKAERPGVVVAVSQAGKDRFLSDRAQALAELLRAGIAVCLPDVRATGETAPSADRGDGGPFHSISQLEFDLGGSLLGSRLMDLRTVLGYLRNRDDFDSKRIGMWGDSFSPSNPADLFLDELQFEGGPQIQHRGEPLGAHLALLAALYENDVRAVAAQGGLAGYLTVLDDAFAYTPIDVIVHGILKTGDIADIAAGLAPRPLLQEASVNGRNILVQNGDLQQEMQPAFQAYRDAGAADRLTIRAQRGDAASWLVTQLQ
jgi:hypothetical protein